MAKITQLPNGLDRAQREQRREWRKVFDDMGYHGEWAEALLDELSKTMAALQAPQEVNIPFSFSQPLSDVQLQELEGCVRSFYAGQLAEICETLDEARQKVYELLLEKYQPR
ncbi:MAG TPA: hypothetical protein ENI17_05920 [Pseudomonas xinjiangensis]|uniref:Uncharacterized protein n=2 Tax=root TaxID=1 RepID=A0A7V1FRD0_9GAMM|nr:hypothetical protein [Halopseudomonas xinjiangensis]HEC47149.1 hypothetical protein [Halopseudomonas xinjiangensis]